MKRDYGRAERARAAYNQLHQTAGSLAVSKTQREAPRYSESEQERIKQNVARLTETAEQALSRLEAAGFPGVEIVYRRKVKSGIFWKRATFEEVPGWIVFDYHQTYITEGFDKTEVNLLADGGFVYLSSSHNGGRGVPVHSEYTEDI